MNKIAALVLAALAVFALGAAAQQGLSSPAAAPTETAILKQRIDELQSRLSALEARVAAINKPQMHRAESGK